LSHRLASYERPVGQPLSRKDQKKPGLARGWQLPRIQPTLVSKDDISLSYRRRIGVWNIVR
jgi:hypothetical protein